MTWNTGHYIKTPPGCLLCLRWFSSYVLQNFSQLSKTEVGPVFSLHPVSSLPLTLQGSWYHIIIYFLKKIELFNSRSWSAEVFRDKKENGIVKQKENKDSWTDFKRELYSSAKVMFLGKLEILIRDLENTIKCKQ